MRWSCEAISSAYQHLLEENYWLAGSGAGKQLQADQSEVIGKFMDWMKKNYVSCKDQLLGLLTHESRDVQVRIDTVM